MIKIVLIAAAAVGFIAVYGVIIHTFLQAHAAAVGKSQVIASSTGLTKIGAYLLGWKTLICAWAAGIGGVLTAIPSEQLQTWSMLPWSGVVDQKVASGITIVFGLLAGLFHAQGMAQSAQTPPQNGG